GKFYTTAVVTLPSNVILRGRGAASIIVKNGDFYAIESIGSDGNEKTNVQIRDLKVTRNASDTSAKSLIYFEYVDNYLISNVFFEDYYNSGFRNNYSDFGLVAGCHFSTETEGTAIYISFGSKNTIEGNFIDGGKIGFFIFGDYNNIINNHIKNLLSTSQMRAIYISGDDNKVAGNIITDCLSYAFTVVAGSLSRGIYVAGNRNTIIGNTIDNCVYTGLFIESGKQQTVVTNNLCKDNGNLIDRANCESATSPMIFGETVPVLSGVTWARSITEAYEGTYSWKIASTGAAGRAELTDSIDTADMHGIIPGLTYTFSFWVFVPAGGMLGTEAGLRIQDYVGGWNTTDQAGVNVYDGWQFITVTRPIPAAATGFTLRVLFGGAASEFYYVDNIRLLPLGIHNEHEQNFLDNGTDTQVG
ncbi:hypothetical protein LCGC14_2702730, partial [marine sediment metagenome]